MMEIHLFEAQDGVKDPLRRALCGLAYRITKAKHAEPVVLAWDDPAACAVCLKWRQESAPPRPQVYPQRVSAYLLIQPIRRAHSTHR